MTSFSKLLLALSASISLVSGQKSSTTTVDDQFKPLLGITDQNAVGGKIYTTCDEQNKWAMTYDDGPTEFTKNLLDTLDKKGIKATFFVVGEMVQENPEILKDAFNRGHEIGVHTWTHPHLNSLSNAQVIQEVKSTYDIIKKTIGQGPLLVRPPYVEANKRVSEILSKMGFTIVNWNVDSEDALNGAGVVIKRIKEQLPGKDRGIVLEHDLQQDFVDQAEGVINLVQAKGPTFVKISDCLGVAPFGELDGSNDGQVTTTQPTITTSSVTISTLTTSSTAVLSVATVTTAAASVTTTTATPSTAPSATTTSAATYLFSNLLLTAILSMLCIL